MALIRSESGCKVGWEFYDDEEEARQRAAALVPDRERMLSFGYDFGYQWPGTVEKVADGWMVTVP